MCQSHTGCLTGLWFLPKLAFGLNTNDDMITMQWLSSLKQKDIKLLKFIAGWVLSMVLMRTEENGRLVLHVWNRHAADNGHAKIGTGSQCRFSGRHSTSQECEERHQTISSLSMGLNMSNNLCTQSHVLTAGPTSSDKTHNRSTATEVL